MFCYLKLKQNTFKNIISLPFRKREGGVLDQEGPQVLYIFARFTTKFKWKHNPEPCNTWGHTAQQPHLLTLTRSLPCREEALKEELDVWEWKRKERSRFFFSLRSLLSCSGARAIIQPDLLHSTEFENSQRE